MTTPDYLPPTAGNSLVPATITGPTLLGILMNWGLMGVLGVQLYIFSETSKDRTLLKALVYGLAILDVLQTALLTADAFHWFVYGFGTIKLNDSFMNAWDVPILDSVIALIVQTFYGWRIHVLRGGLVMPGLIFMVSLTQCAAGIFTGVRNMQIGKLSLSSEWIVPETIWLAAGALADIAIAGVLSWTFLRWRDDENNLPGHNSLLSRLTRLVAETNALTAVVAVCAIGLFWGFPGTALVSVPIAIIGKLYTNCLLALFNNRPRAGGVTTMNSMSTTQVSGPVSFVPSPRIKVYHDVEAGMDFGRLETG